jgi:hypothetical protein
MASDRAEYRIFHTGGPDIFTPVFPGRRSRKHHRPGSGAGDSTLAGAKCMR